MERLDEVVDGLVVELSEVEELDHVEAMIAGLAPGDVGLGLAQLPGDLDLGQARRHAGAAEPLGDGAVAFGEDGLAHGRLLIVISV